METSRIINRLYVQMYVLILVCIFLGLSVKIIKLPVVGSDGTCCTDIPNDVHIVLRNNKFGCNILNFGRLFRGAKTRIK
jgi:hypothetical protein